MNYLQITLLSNALFSSLSGILLIVFQNFVAAWFGQESSTVFWVIGVGLLFFSYSVFTLITNPKPDAVFYIIMQDFIWVLASIVILILKPFNIAVPGHQIIAGVAFLVLLFGIGQSLGIAQTDSTTNKGMKRLSFERIVHASKGDAWKVISDVSNYHKVAPNIDDVSIVSGDGQGMVRQCSHGQEKWTESCTLWEEGRKYSFQVNTDDEDYPYPLNYLKGTWELEEVAELQTRIIMTFEFRYKRKIYNVLLHPFMRNKFNRISEELLDNWENITEAKATYH